MEAGRHCESAQKMFIMIEKKPTYYFLYTVSLCVSLALSSCCVLSYRVAGIQAGVLLRAWYIWSLTLEADFLGRELDEHVCPLMDIQRRISYLFLLSRAMSESDHAGTFLFPLSP